MRGERSPGLKPVQVWMREELKEAIRRRAEEDGVSVSEWLRRVAEKELGGREEER